eukprot:g1204.t1
MGVRELKVCIQVLDVDVEPDCAHINWEIQIVTIFDDATLCGVAMQDGLNGKIWTPGAGSSGGSKRSKSGAHKSNKRMRELWENVKKQWTIPNVTKMERLKPDQVRIIDPRRGTVRLANHLRIRQFTPLDARLFPYDVHVLRLRIIPTKPRDLVVFSENPTLYVDNELKSDNGDISDASIWRGWDVKYYDANLEFTHPHHSFTSSAYHVLEASITIERKPGYSRKITSLVANVALCVLWSCALIPDPGTAILTSSLMMLGVVQVFHASDRPKVPYLTLHDARFDHVMRWGVYPTLAILFIFAALETVFTYDSGLERDLRNFVIYARLGCIFLCPAIYKIGQCAWGCELKAHRTKNEYTLNIQKHSSLSATVKEPDLPEDMSIFTLWESKQFLGRKNTPVPESAQRAFKRRRPQSAGPRGRRGPHGAEPLDSRKGVYSAYASPAMRERAAIKGLIPMNQGNGDTSGDAVDKRTGKEQWLPAGKHVYFEGTGTLQDNVHRDKLRGSTKGILLKPTIGISNDAGAGNASSGEGYRSA